MNIIRVQSEISAERENYKKERMDQKTSAERILGTTQALPSTTFWSTQSVTDEFWHSFLSLRDSFKVPR